MFFHHISPTTEWIQNSSG